MVCQDSGCARLMRRQRAEEVGTDSPGGAPAPKRRRLTGSSTVLRPAAELRESLELLYVRLQGEPVADDAPPSANPSFLQAEMVIVRALGASGEQSFRCLRSLLASASRPLAAMLYGSDGLRMRESDAGSIDLHSVEPSTFALLLHYMHGKALQLDVQSATSLYALADYYDISSLREACCDFLKAGVRPDCVCWWLSQAREIRCERLASRCLEVLQAELIAVDATDPDFRSIAEADLACALMSSSVVCTGERDVWDALQRWAHGRADQPAALERLARHIRWPLLEGAQLQALLSARSSRSLAFLRAHASAALEYQRASAEAREADPSFARMAELAMPRQYLLGELIVVSQPGARRAPPARARPRARGQRRVAVPRGSHLLRPRAAARPARAGSARRYAASPSHLRSRLLPNLCSALLRSPPALRPATHKWRPARTPAPPTPDDARHRFRRGPG